MSMFQFDHKTLIVWNGKYFLDFYEKLAFVSIKLRSFFNCVNN